MKTEVEKNRTMDLETPQNVRANNLIFNDKKALIITTKPEHFLKLREPILDHKNNHQAPFDTSEIFYSDHRLSIPYRILKNYPDIIRLLVNYGINMDDGDKNDNTLLHTAARRGEAIVVKTLLECKANCNVKNYKNETPLLLAAEEGHIEIVKLLIAYRAEIEIQEAEGYTPLLAAASKGQNTIVEYLLARGANIEAKDFQHYTVLFHAIANGHIETVDLLLKEGACTEPPDLPQNLSTALSVAAFYRYPDILRLLLTKGVYTSSNIEVVINDNKHVPEIVNILTTFQMVKHNNDLFENKQHAEIVMLKSEIELCKNELIGLNARFRTQEDQINELQREMHKVFALKKFLIESGMMSPEQIESAVNSNLVPDIDVNLIGGESL